MPMMIAEIEIIIIIGSMKFTYEFKKNKKAGIVCN